MYVVYNSANGEWLYSILTSDTADVWPKARLEFWLNKGESLLCTEGAVHEVTDIRVSEAPFWVIGFFSRPLCGLRNSINAAASQQ